METNLLPEKQINKFKKLEEVINELEKFYGNEIRDINDVISDVFNHWVVLNTYIRDLTNKLEEVYSKKNYTKEDILKELLSEIECELTPVASHLEIDNNWFTIKQARNLINAVANCVAD